VRASWRSRACSWGASGNLPRPRREASYTIRTVSVKCSSGNCSPPPHTPPFPPLPPPPSPPSLPSPRPTPLSTPREAEAAILKAVEALDEHAFQKAGWVWWHALGNWMDHQDLTGPALQRIWGRCVAGTYTVRHTRRGYHLVCVSCLVVYPGAPSVVPLLERMVGALWCWCSSHTSVPSVLWCTVVFVPFSLYCALLFSGAGGACRP